MFTLGPGAPWVQATRGAASCDMAPWHIPLSIQSSDNTRRNWHYLPTLHSPLSKNLVMSIKWSLPRCLAGSPLRSSRGSMGSSTDTASSPGRCS
jgi:hypothetical protein